MRELESVQRDPSGFADYMSTYGCHFSKRMCEWAVSMMMVDEKQPDGTVKQKKLAPWNREEVEALLAKNGVSLKNDKGYDKVYVANMCKADFIGRSVTDDSHVSMYVKDLLDDPDGYEGLVFNRFMMDCIGKGIPVMWEDML